MPFYVASRNGDVTELRRDGALVETLDHAPLPNISRPRALPMSSYIGAKQGPMVKVAQAARHIDTLKRAINEYYDVPALELLVGVDRESGETVFLMRELVEIPGDITAYVGDVLHNLRAALDQLTHGAIVKYGGTITRETGFPVAKDKTSFKSLLPRRLSGSPPRYARFVRGLRVYPLGNNLLYQVHELDIFDKHKDNHPVNTVSIAISATASINGMFVLPNGNLAIGNPPAGSTRFGQPGRPMSVRQNRVLEGEMEIYRGPEGFQFDIDATYAIGLMSGGVVLFPVLLDFLEDALAVVGRIVLKGLAITQ